MLGREANRPLGEVEALETIPDGVDRRRAEGKDAQVLHCGAEPEQRPPGGDEGRHAVARALLGVGRETADDVPDVGEGRLLRRREAIEIVVHGGHARGSSRIAAPAMLVDSYRMGNTFATIPRMGRAAPTGGRKQLRWRLADDDGGRPELLAGAERHRAGRARRAGAAARAGPAHHQRGPGRLAGAVPLDDQPVPRLQPRLRLLLRAADHEYLGLGIGDDFDRRIVVKINAVERLRAEPARLGGRAT